MYRLNAPTKAARLIRLSNSRTYSSVAPQRAPAPASAPATYIPSRSPDKPDRPLQSRQKPTKPRPVLVRSTFDPTSPWYDRQKAPRRTQKPAVNPQRSELVDPDWLASKIISNSTEFQKREAVIRTYSLHNDWPFMPSFQKTRLSLRSAGEQLDKTLTAWKATQHNYNIEEIDGAVSVWAWFRDNVATLDVSVRTFSEWKHPFGTVRSQIIKFKEQDPTNLKLPSVTEIFQMGHKMGSPLKGTRNLLQISLAQANYVAGRLIETSVIDPKTGSMLLSEKPDHMIDAILTDQEIFWKVLLAKPGDTYGTFVISQVSLQQVTEATKWNIPLETTLFRIVPWLNPQSNQNLPAAIIAWYLMTSMQAAKTVRWGPIFKELRRSMEMISMSYKLDLNKVKEILAGSPELLERLIKIAGLQQNPNRPLFTLDNLINDMHQKSGVALVRRRPQDIKLHIRELQAFCDHYHIEGDERELVHNYFNYLMHCACALSDTESFSIIGKVMSILGYQMNVKTYTSMITGWTLSRKIDSIRNVYAMAIDKKVKLDSHFWGSLIHAFASVTNARSVVNVLFEMASLHDSNPDFHPAPDIISVNAVISSMFKFQDVAAVNQILAWAEKRGIEHDRVTYNTLIQGLISSKRPEDVPKLLEAMTERGLSPDSATFTILMEQSLTKDTEYANSEQKVAAVERALMTFTESGIPIEHNTYAKMLSVLTNRNKLPDPESCHAACQTVISHMTSRGISPSRYAHTVLVAHLFSLGSSEQVIELLRDWQLERIISDPAFWDTVVRGFAKLGDLEWALHYEKKFHSWFFNTRMTLNTHLAFLRLFLKEGDEESARRQVQKAVDEMEGAGDLGERHWDHRFWAIARDELGITVRDVTKAGIVEGQQQRGQEGMGSTGW